MLKMKKNKNNIEPEIRLGQNKILVGVMLVVFMTSFASAGWFDWLTGEDEKEKTFKELIDDNWIKTYNKVFKWKGDKLKFKEKKIKIDKDNEVDLDYGIVIKENEDGIKVVYNEG